MYKSWFVMWDQSCIFNNIKVITNVTPNMIMGYVRSSVPPTQYMNW